MGLSAILVAAHGWEPRIDDSAEGRDDAAERDDHGSAGRTPRRGGPRGPITKRRAHPRRRRGVLRPLRIQQDLHGGHRPHRRAVTPERLPPLPDKAALFNEVAAARARIFLEEIVRRTAELEGLSAQIEEVARLTNRFVREDPISAALRLADPDSLARMVSTEARELISMAMDAIVPLIETARDTGEVRADLHVMRAAEWIARMVFSLSATPSVTFDIDDPEQTAAFIREFLLPGLR
ncbi:MAG: hypothetical protein M5U19_21320 [Microthrixaceae bacterium]|nr:hypothetical protein [Microthrixaceae bacterium]